MTPQIFISPTCYRSTTGCLRAGCPSVLSWSSFWKYISAPMGKGKETLEGVMWTRLYHLHSKFIGKTGHMAPTQPQELQKYNCIVPCAQTGGDLKY